LKRLGMGIVGAGFVGPHHLDAVRRLGFVDVVGIAGSSEASAKAKAEQLGIPKSYAGYEALVRDPDIQVVHNTTPNYLHYPVNLAVIDAGKHIVSDKPLAMNAAEARKLRDAARAKGVVHAVTFNYRGNPLVQQMRLMIARGDIGRPHFVFGQYLQDWLLFDTDYSWRLEPDKGGASSALGDIGSHWCDVAQHVSGARITEVLADLSTTIKKRKKPSGAREAFAAGKADDKVEDVEMKVEDLATVLVRFDSGARGVFSVSQVSAGHKNDLFLEVNGANGSMRWYQEQQNELWIGRRDQPNQVLVKDPSLLDEPARRYAHLPGGHQEAWTDAFCNLMRDIYGFIAEGRDPKRDEQPPAFATFEDGYRANCLVDAMLESAKAGTKWVKVEY
jgi:predicted dehydrogenase